MNNHLEFVNAALELREKRKTELNEGKQRFNILSVETPSWEYQELYEYFPAIKRLRNGTAKNMPSRTEVLSLADYLRCDLHERNRLLVSAGYPRLETRMSEDSQEKILQIAKHSAHYLGLPSYMLDIDWRIWAWNDQIIKLLDITEEAFLAIPIMKRNLLWLLFDKDLPIYRLIAHSPAIWEYTAKRNILGFKLDNYNSQYEEWFVKLINNCCQLPRFREFWNEVQLDSWQKIAPNEPMAGYTTDLLLKDGSVVQVTSLITKFGNWNYPQVISYIPASSHGEAAFESFGIKLPKSRWQ